MLMKKSCKKFSVQVEDFIFPQRIGGNQMLQKSAKKLSSSSNRDLETFIQTT